MAFEADRAKDAELQALGYRVLRFTFRQVRGARERSFGDFQALMGS